MLARIFCFFTSHSASVIVLMAAFGARRESYRECRHPAMFIRRPIHHQLESRRPRFRSALPQRRVHVLLRRLERDGPDEHLRVASLFSRDERIARIALEKHVLRLVRIVERVIVRAVVVIHGFLRPRAFARALERRVDDARAQSFDDSRARALAVAPSELDAPRDVSLARLVSLARAATALARVRRVLARVLALARLIARETRSRTPPPRGRAVAVMSPTTAGEAFERIAREETRDAASMEEFAALATAPGAIERVDVATATTATRPGRGAALVDVRSPVEYERGRVPGSGERAVV